MGGEGEEGVSSIALQSAHLSLSHLKQISDEWMKCLMEA